jgi:hypothetical protein
MARFRRKILASAGATLGMAVLPAAYVALEAYGPASRVAVREYLPVEGFITAAVALVLGASLGAEAHRFCWPGRGVSSALRLVAGNLAGGAVGLTASVGLALLSSRTLGEATPWRAALLLAGVVAAAACVGGTLMFRAADPPRRWNLGLQAKLVAFGLLAAWLLLPQLRAFPARGSLAERDAWARANVPAYPALARVVAECPEVLADVGRVEAMAPTGTDRHSSAQGMNGDDVRFTLEVIGEGGTGTLLADCTLIDGAVLDWHQGRWTFAGKVVRIDSVPARLRWSR